jgi:hypothetical protein
MTEIPYNDRRRLLSAAKDLMSDIQQHTKSMHTALSLVNSERVESFHADEIMQDTIMLEMILEDFQGDIPEEFESIQTEVEQRKKMYGDIYGDEFYIEKRKDLEEELDEASSVPEATEAEKEYMKKHARRFTPRIYDRTKKKKEPEEPRVELVETGKVVRIYSFEDQEELFENKWTDDKNAPVVEPLVARLEEGDPLFSELPEHYTIVCLEKDQQIQVDELQTLQSNPFYAQSLEVKITLSNASESGKNMFRLQQLYERLQEEYNGDQ